MEGERLFPNDPPLKKEYFSYQGMNPDSLKMGIASAANTSIKIV